MAPSSSAPAFHIAADRAVIRVSGGDRVAFLQGIISNDAERIAPGRAVWAAFLTPQGKYLHDFFAVADTDATSILLDCEAARADDLLKRLRRYTLRSDVKLAREPDAAVALADGLPEPVSDLGCQFADPRLPEAGTRLIGNAPALRAGLEAAGAKERDAGAWDRRRIFLGLPDGGARFRRRAIDAGRRQCRPAGLHRLAEGMLDGPGSDGPHPLSRTGETSARPDACGGSGAGARHTG